MRGPAVCKPLDQAIEVSLDVGKGARRRRKIGGYDEVLATELILAMTKCLADPTLDLVARDSVTNPTRHNEPKARMPCRTGRHRYT